MRKSLDALKEGFKVMDGGFVYQFGDGYELFFEPLMFDDQWYVALYRNKELLTPKVCVKLGKL